MIRRVRPRASQKEGFSGPNGGKPNLHSHAVIELSGYEFESLRTGKEFNLYRGRGVGEFLPILVRAPSSERPEPATLKRLEHEYSLRNDLDPEWAARPLGLSQLEGRTVLILEDPGGELLDRFVGEPMELSRFLLLAINLAAGLGELHRLGPTLSMRGIDNAAYYRLAGDGQHYVDFTGCGNSLNVSHPCVLKLIMDSLRYWVLEMRVDGFRFDLASALARQLRPTLLERGRRRGRGAGHALVW